MSRMTKGSHSRIKYIVATARAHFLRMYRLRPSLTSHDHADWTGPCARVVSRVPSWSEAKSLMSPSAGGTCVQSS